MINGRMSNTRYHQRSSKAHSGSQQKTVQCTARDQSSLSHNGLSFRYSECSYDETSCTFLAQIIILNQNIIVSQLRRFSLQKTLLHPASRPPPHFLSRKPCLRFHLFSRTKLSQQPLVWLSRAAGSSGQARASAKSAIRKS